jgi:serine phosphatase RsbU (regulator of sigma subunit)
MARPPRDDGATGSMPLWMRFSLLMTAALTVVMFFAGYALYSNGSAVAQRAQEAILVEGVELSSQFARQQGEVDAIRAELAALKVVDDKFRSSGQRLPPETLALRDELRKYADERTAELLKAEERRDAVWKRANPEQKDYDGGALRWAVKHGPRLDRDGFLYRARGENGVGYDLFVPAHVNRAEQGLLRLILGLSALVVLVGAGMSVFAARQVSGPLEQIVKDIQQISHGFLDHRVRAGAGSEVRQLAQAINRMTKDLSEARETEVALSVRDREMAVAGEVREALLPKSMPKVAGYETGALHLSSAELGGDFHDFIELADGRVGCLVCDVSGKGLPGALVGATARSYLRAELARGGDVKQALFCINRELARDVRRGMYVSALYVVVDPREHRAQVACAGHKIPLVRFCAADGKIRTVHPEGIALGFDKGPVFEKALQVVDVPLEKGDRLVLANSGPAILVNGKGEEYGEKQLYVQIQRFGAKPNQEFLDRLRTVLEGYVDGVPLARDVSIVTIARV